jgi:hypothetical protein
MIQADHRPFRFHTFIAATKSPAAFSIASPFTPSITRSCFSCLVPLAGTLGYVSVVKSLCGPAVVLRFLVPHLSLLPSFLIKFGFHKHSSASLLCYSLHHSPSIHSSHGYFLPSASRRRQRPIPHMQTPHGPYSAALLLSCSQR